VRVFGCGNPTAQRKRQVATPYGGPHHPLALLRLAGEAEHRILDPKGGDL